MAIIDEHPSIYLEDYKKYFSWLLLSAIAQIIWTSVVFYYSVAPPEILKPYSNPNWHPGVLYSVYSGLHAGYVLVCLLLGSFLYSRGWIRAAAFASLIPGPGFLFGIFTILPAAIVFYNLGKPHWKIFFAWRDRSNPIIVDDEK